MAELSIIITTHNSADYIGPCLRSIFGQKTGLDFEVVVFDNKSRDNTAALIKDGFKKVVLFENGVDLGFSGANNEAVLRCASDAVLLLNADTKLSDGALDRLRAELPEVRGGGVIMSPMQLSYDAGVFLNCGLGLDLFGFPINEGPEDRYFYADGAALLMLKKDFIGLGMFDDRHYLIQEDVDLSWKARLLGYRFKRLKDVVVYHKSGHSIGTGSTSTKVFSTSVARRYYGERNGLRNLFKNYALANLIWILPLVVATHCLEAALFLVLGKPRVSWAYARAYGWNLRNARSTMERRRWIQSRRIVGDGPIMKNMYKGSAKLKLLLDVGIPTVK